MKQIDNLNLALILTFFETSSIFHYIYHNSLCKGKKLNEVHNKSLPEGKNEVIF